MASKGQAAKGRSARQTKQRAVKVDQNTVEAAAPQVTPTEIAAVASQLAEVYWTALEPPSLLSCWVAIDDATVENGCVHVLPGSHKQLLPHRAFDGPQSWGLPAEDMDTIGEIPVPLKAGSAMFHHSCLIHRSFPNRSEQGRRGLVTIYLPSSLHFVEPWNFQYGWKPLRGEGVLVNENH